MANTPFGIPVDSAAFKIAVVTISEVLIWPEWPFITTGQPAAKAEAVSPPAVENANGKLLAAKTATGPIGCNILRISTLGSGCLSGIALSILASTHEPSSTKSANIRNWPQVRPRSPKSLASGKLVSAMVV